MKIQEDSFQVQTTVPFGTDLVAPIKPKREQTVDSQTNSFGPKIPQKCLVQNLNVSISILTREREIKDVSKLNVN